MNKLFNGAVTVLMLAVVVQVFLAGSGAFDNASRDDAFAPHRALGYSIVLAAIVVTALGAVVKVPPRLLGMIALTAGLILLEPVIANLAEAVDDSTGPTTTGGKLVFGVHAVNGLVIAALLGTIMRKSRQLSTRTARSGQKADDPAS